MQCDDDGDNELREERKRFWNINNWVALKFQDERSYDEGKSVDSRRVEAIFS